MSKGNIEAGKAFVTLFLKNNLTGQLSKALLGVKKQLAQMASGVRFVAGTLNQLSGIATKAGLGLTAPFAFALARLPEAKKMFGEMGDAITEGLGKPLLPIVKLVRDVVVRFAEWAKANPQVVVTLFKIGVGLTVAGLALQALASVAIVAAAGLAAASAAAGALAGIVAFVGSPLGVVVTLLGASAAAWLLFTENGRAAVQGVVQFMAPLAETLKTTFGGIADALMGGEFMLAAQIAMAGLQVVVAQAVDQIADLIGGVLGQTFQTIGNQIIQGDFAGAWDTAVAGMAVVWDSFVAGIVTAFASAIEQVGVLWRQAIAMTQASLSVFQAGLQALGLGGAAASVGGLKMGVAGEGNAIGSGLGGLSSAADAVAGAKVGKAVGSAAGFGNRIAGGSAAAEEELRRRQDELAALRKRAGELPAAPGLGGLGGVMSTASSFSAGGAMAMGFGGGATSGPAGKMVAVLEKNGKKEDMMLKVLQEIERKIQGGGVFRA